MPTGYTSFIENGKIDNAKDFLMLCARNFGATVTMRDNSLSDPIPKQFEPNSYYLDELNEAKANLEKINNMSDDEIQDEINEEYDNEQKRCKEKIEKDKIIYERHKQVLNDVKKWNPPTKEHNALKSFAIEQINMVLDEYDSHYYLDKLKENRPSVSEWKKSYKEQCLDDIEYYSDEYKKEADKIKFANKWLKELRESLIK